jgi:uncharacterized membrane protein YtjA (UPF0391 family)
MRNWAILFLTVGLIAGLVAFAGISAGVWTFMLLAAFFVLMLDGVMLFMAGPRGTRRLT